MKYALALFVFQFFIQGAVATLYYMDRYCGSSLHLRYQNRTHLRLTSHSTYSPSMSCSVVITSNRGGMAFYFVNFSVEQCCDFLEIHDGADSHGANLTGKITSFPTGTFETNTSKMSLYFHSDGSIESSGFEMIIDTSGELDYISVRLVNGSMPWAGRVEVYYQGQWGTVCDDDFDANDSYVICKMLGFGRYRYPEVHDRAYYGAGSGRITVDNLRCSGNESSIANCRSNPWLSHNCHHSEDVGIDCYTPLSSQTSSAAQWTTWFHNITMPYITVRLINGYHPWQGRVEVYYQGQWGTVCDDGFGADDAYVVCKMLGFVRYRYPEVYTGAYYGTGSGRITVDNLDCSGYESSIENCRSNPWLSHDCSHSEDVGIDCHIPYSSQASTATPFMTRTTQTTRFYSTKRNVRLEDAISVNCNEYGWDIRVDMVIMRSMYPNIRASDIYLGKNLCTGLNYGSSVLFHQGLRECLTSETISGSQLIYRNELVYAIHDENNPFLIRRYNWTVEVECDIGRNQTASGHLHHDFSSGTSHHVSGISSNYSVKLSFFQDPNFIMPLQGNPINVKVGTKVYVKVYTAASDWDVKMVVHDCYTKPTPGSPDHTKYAIIRNGCEVDSNTHIISQSTHETRFVFEDFEYTSNHEGIHLFCDATFCSSSDYSSHCQQRCHSFG